MKSFAAVVVVAAVVCLWLGGGATPRTFAAVGAASTPVAISVGPSYTVGCVVFSGASVKCWGYKQRRSEVKGI